MIYFQNIKGNYESYNFLINFYHENKDNLWENIDISFKDVKFIAAHNCSIIGAIFQKIQSSLNTIKLIDIFRPKDILLRNGFLSFWGFEKIIDLNKTTVEYLKLHVKDSRFFSYYIQNELLTKKNFPIVSDKLKKKIVEGIYEIFNNAVIHSETKEGIFTCGQFFPNVNRIEFMITDLGIGIKNKINTSLGSDFDSIEAINWAMDGNNTTKKDVSGGIGLKILKEFITLNKGKIQVISNNGFWEMSENGINTKFFDNDFPGTSVNLCFITKDPAHYILSEEIADNDIF